MVVNQRHSHHVVANEKGQSILEVVFVLPFLFLFVGLLYKINMAVQMAINNTQYARSQLYILTNNQPEYPRLQFRVLGATSFSAQQQDRIVLGVADPSTTDFNDQTGKIDPNPQTQKIARGQTTVKGSEDRGDSIKNRNEIRVRNTAAICTQLNTTNGTVPMIGDASIALASQRWPFKQKICRYKGEG